MPTTKKKKKARAAETARREASRTDPTQPLMTVDGGGPLPGPSEVSDTSDTGLRVEYVPLTLLRRAPRNPKDHDLGALSQSFTRFGFTAPVIMDDRTGTLIAGHGRLDGLLQRQQLGDSPPKGIRQEPDGNWSIPVVRGWASKDDADAEAYLIADNQLTIMGGWKEAELAAILTSLATNSTLEGTGFDADDLDDLLTRLDEDANTPESDASMLKRIGVTIEEPNTPVEKGQVWTLRGTHLLVICDPVKEVPRWRPYIGECDVFAPYPGPYAGVVISKPEDGKVTEMTGKRILLVQPNLFIAGHLLDQVKRVYGESAVVLNPSV